MDPAIANQNLDPPKERVLSRGLLPALVVNLVLMSALALGVDWNVVRRALPMAETAPPAMAEAANDTARMGGAPAPSSGTEDPAWPTAAATGPLQAEAAQPAPVAPAAAAAPREQAAPVAVAKPAGLPTADRAAPAKPVQVAKAEPRAKPLERAAERRTDGRTQPSFECAKARSPTERLICADPELARLDRDLGRVHAQAKRSTPDPQDFKRENDDEWHLREAVCRDKDCLLEWYAHRKQQLQERMAQGR